MSKELGNILQPLKTDKNTLNLNIHHSKNHSTAEQTNGKSMEMKYISLRNNQKKENRVLSSIKENNMFFSGGLNMSIGPKKLNLNNNENSMTGSIKMGEKDVQNLSNNFKNRSISSNVNPLATGLNTSIKYPTQVYKS